MLCLSCCCVFIIESKRERIKKLNSRLIQELKHTSHIYTELIILSVGEYHKRTRSRLAVPELGHFLSRGAGEATGGNKPPGQI